MTLPPNEWMPVFVVVGRRRSAPGIDDESAPMHDEDTPDEVQRIGTAWRNDDGSYLVSLSALPVNGELLIRPPRLGDALYPAHGRERVEVDAHA
jgi:hypothetical protein